MPNRSFVGTDYRYGYQGSEKDDEIKGNGNSYTTHYRHLDTRIGRWMSRDPKSTAFESPYASMNNNPILYNDIKGDTIKIRNNRTDYLYEFDKKNGGQLYTMLNGTKSVYSGRVDGFLRDSFESLNDLNSNSDNANKILSDIQNSRFSVKIDKSSTNEFNETNSYNSYAYARFMNGQGESLVTEIGSSGTVSWNPNRGGVWELNQPSQVSKTTTNLFHELVHAWDSFNGNLDNTFYNNTSLKKQEARAVYYENLVRMDLNYNKREYYLSTPDPNTGLNIPYAPRTLDGNNNPIFVDAPSAIYLESKLGNLK